MPAEVTITNSKAELAYTGETPWHGLGTKVDHHMTSREAIEAAGLAWSVTKMPLYTKGQRNGGTSATGYYGIFREDTGECFMAGCKNQYTPLQNMDAFSFMDGVLGEGLATYEVVGSLAGGRKVFALAKLPESIEVAHRDSVDQYLLLANSHDGTTAVTVQWTPIRVVCNNTLTAALAQKGRKFHHRHTLNFSRSIGDAREILGLASQYFKEWAIQAEALVTRQLTRAEELVILGQVFTLDQDRVTAIATDGGAHKGREQALLDCLTLAHYGQGNESFAGTAWGLFNGVTEWIDHHCATRDLTGDRRLYSSWFEDHARLRDRAWSLIAA